MAELLVLGFRNNVYRASGVLDELRVLDEQWISKLRDAIAVHFDAAGHIRMDQRYQPTSQHGLGWSGSLGFLIGATLTLPITAPLNSIGENGAMNRDVFTASVRGVSNLLFLKNDVGLPESFVLGVRELIGAGDSAIFTLTESSDPEVALARFQAYGASVRHVPLSTFQQAQIENALESDR